MGEKRDDRAKIDKLTEAIASDGIPTRRAHQLAKESMERVVRRQTVDGKS